MKKYVRSSSELDPRFNFSFDEIGPEFWLKTTTEPARIYLEDENVEGNGACMRYSIIVVIPGDQDHWQMKEDITDSFERHLEDVTDGSDYTYNIISVKKCYDWPYAIPDEIPIDSTLYRVVFDIVPYQNIGPDGDYGIDFGVEDIESSKKINCDEEVVEEISEEVVNDPNAVRTYRNRRNENKFIETKKYADGHSVARQYMKWDTPEGEVKNYMGSKSNRGRWFRAGQHTRDMMLDDYDEVVVDETIESAAELDDRFDFSFDEIGDEIYIDARANYVPIYLEDERVIGNGAGMEYDVIVAVPRSADHWQMGDKIQDSLDKHVQDVTDGTDYYGSAVVTESHAYPKYANIPDDVYEDSVFYSATIEVVPYDNIGPDGTYGINYAYDYE